MFTVEKGHLWLVIIDYKKHLVQLTVITLNTFQLRYSCSIKNALKTEPFVKMQKENHELKKMNLLLRQGVNFNQFFRQLVFKWVRPVVSNLRYADLQEFVLNLKMYAKFLQYKAFDEKAIITIRLLFVKLVFSQSNNPKMFDLYPVGWYLYRWSVKGSQLDSALWLSF